MSEIRRFGSPSAFRASLDSHLRKRGDERSAPLQGMQLRFAIERLLARLFHVAEPPWLLKGGYALDLRFRPRARTTKDLDLTMTTPPGGDLEEIGNRLNRAAAVDLGDYVDYEFSDPKSELANAPDGGGRFVCEARIDRKRFVRFQVDVGLGDTRFGEPERLVGEDLLDFMGIGPAVALAIPKEQQFAEKLHAYAFPWTGRVNTRAKDLVDLVLLIERGSLDPAATRAALCQTFETRGTSPVPTILPMPPAFWAEDHRLMSAQAGLVARDLTAAFDVLSRYWKAHLLGGS